MLYAYYAGVSSMGRTEGIIDIDITQTAKLVSEVLYFLEVA